MRDVNLPFCMCSVGLRSSEWRGHLNLWNGASSSWNQSLDDGCSVIVKGWTTIATILRESVAFWKLSTKTLPLPLWPADLLIQDRMLLLTPNSHPSNYCNSLSSTFGEHMWIVIWVIVAFLSVQSKLLLWTTRYFYTENCRSVDIFSFSDHSRLTVEIVGWKKYSKLTPPITSFSISHKSLFSWHRGWNYDTELHNESCYYIILYHAILVKVVIQINKFSKDPKALINEKTVTYFKLQYLFNWGREILLHSFLAGHYITH